MPAEEVETQVKQPYGMVVAPSTATEIQVSAYRDKNTTPIVGQNVYTDQQLNDNYVYRSIGTVTEVSTSNNGFTGAMRSGALQTSTNSYGIDLSNIAGNDTDEKTFTMRIQATYKRRVGDENAPWEQVGIGLLSSPATASPIYILDQETLMEILGDSVDDCVYIGTYRGLSGVNMPLRIQGFATRRGATHAAIIGRSGSGKTSTGHNYLGAVMKNQTHAIIVTDPQGQWSNENGFLWSLQALARRLGREVIMLRVSEDIRLPLRAELLGSIMNELRLWSALQRMGSENAEALSDEVAKLVVSYIRENRHVSTPDIPRNALLHAFGEIAQNENILARIYARGGDAGNSLKFVLGSIADVIITDKDGMDIIYSSQDLANGQEALASVLSKFTPLINLFLKENLNGAPRRSLDGRYGFLSNILRAREPDEIAPYVILDMSSDVSLHAQDQYARSVQRVIVPEDEDDEDDVYGIEDPTRNMRVMLDNPDIKARIVSTVLDSVVRQAESAFADGAKNLDTQIVFDEAWRYAPSPSAVTRGSAIHKLTERLAGYALDTRKYGVGWTYILQSPNDLNPTIWRQLTYVWSGYGMMSADRRMMEDLVDDRSQLRLYDQFADPNATNVYPFMVTGPVNPLIFTSAPSFVNIFNSAQEFLTANSQWIDDLCVKNSLPKFSDNPDSISLASNARDRSERTAPRRTARPVQNRGVGRSGVPADTTSVEITPPPF